MTNVRAANRADNVVGRCAQEFGDESKLVYICLAGRGNATRRETRHQRQ